MEEVLKTIQHITQRYGKDVLLEKRFLYIFNDLYPDRMDKEVHALLSCMYEKGYLKQILKARKRSLKKDVTFISNSLVKDGHAEKDVQQLLRAIIVGIGVATKQEYSDILNGGATNSKSSNVALTITRYALLVLLMAVVIAMPYLYIRSLSILWPIFPITIIIAFCFIVYIAFYRKLSDKWSAFQNGCFNGFMFCLSALLAIFPLWASENSDCGLFYFWSPGYTKEQTDAWFLTMMCSLVVGLLLWATPLMAIIITSIDKKLSKAYKLKMVCGFVSAIICYFICIYPILTKPYNQKKAEINAYNQRIQELKQNRQKINKSLSFCGIQLGDSFERCLSVVRANMNSPELMSGKYAGLDSDYSMVIDNKDYSLIVDSIIKAKTSWDNQDVNVYVYFNKGVNVAIKVTELTQDPLPLFISKYGRPEEDPILDLDYNKTLASNVENDQIQYIRESDSYLNHRENNRWTFKNSIIFIGSDRFNRYEYILYLSRNCEKLYSEYEQYTEKLEQEKRKQEQIKYQRQQREEAIERKREEDNHKRAINEI